MQVAAIAIAAAHAPLVLAYYANLWQLPHYQFFPAALIGAYLLAQRPLTDRAATSVRPSAPATWLGVAFLVGAVLIQSPWLGAVSALVNLLIWQTGRGRRSVRELLPAAAMIAVTLRLPLHGDVWLIQTLQQITARAADAALVVLGILHARSGNVIEVPGKRLLVDEACSGVNSLFAAGACTLFYLLWNRRGWVSSGLLLLCLPVWVVLANVLRILIVAVLRERWDVAADVGLLHDALGFTTFFIAVGLIWSTDRALTFYARVVERPTPPSPATTDIDINDDVPEKTSSGSWMAVAAAAVMLTVVQLPALTNQVQSMADDWTAHDVEEFGEHFLGETWGPWSRTGYELVTRERNSALGRKSQSWSLESGHRQATASLDYPFAGWHELPECYTAQGWQITSRQAIESADFPTVAVALRHEQTGEFGYLFFGLMTGDGQPLELRKLGEVDEWRDRAAARLTSLRNFATVTPSAPTERATYQVQLFIASYAPAADDDLAEYRRIFQTFAAKVRERFVRQAENNVPEDPTR